MKRISKFVLYIFMLFIVFALLNLFFSIFREVYPWPDIFAQNVSFRSLDYIIQDKKIPKSIINSYLIGTTSSVLSVIIAMPIARKLSKSKKSTKLSIIIFLPYIISATSVCMGLQLLFIKLGLAGTSLGIILIQLVYQIPYNIWIIKPGYDGLDENLIYAAKNLGAEEKDLIKNILFPYMVTFIKTAIIMAFILSFSNYYLNLVLGIGLVETFVIIAFPFFSVRDRALSSAMSIIFIVLNLLYILIVNIVFIMIAKFNKWKLS